MAFFDFEDGLFPTAFLNAANDRWEITTADANGGTYSLRSGTAGVDRSTSSFWIYGDFQAGDFTCDYRVSSEGGWDYAYIIVDGVPIVNNISGGGSWTTMPAHTLSAGVHTIQFVFVKDNSASNGDDCFYVDNISVPDFTDIKAAPKYFPAGVPTDWVNDPVYPWIAGSVERMPFDGIQSPAIPDSTSSTLIYNSPSDAPAGEVFFQGRADSANGDTLKFYIDNVEVYSDQGNAYSNPDHGPVGYFGTVTSGSHEYKWVYSTDGSGQEQSSSGYLYTFYEPAMYAAAFAPNVSMTGTLDGSTAAQVRGGGKTVILALQNDTYVAAGSVFDVTRQAFIDLLVSDGSESTGWNAVVRPAIQVADVVRASDTSVTITIPGVSSYSVLAAENISSGAPAAALVTSTSDLTAPTTAAVLSSGEIGAHIGYTLTSGVSYLWEYERGHGDKTPVNVSALAEASLGAGSETWCSISRNGQWMLIRTTRADGSAWDAMYIADMSTYPNSLDFQLVTVGGSAYHPTGIHRITDDGLTIYGVNDADNDQLSKFTRASTGVYDFAETTISTITGAYSTVALSVDETYLIVTDGYDFYKILTASPYTDTLILDESAISLVNTISPTPASDGRVVFEGDGDGGDESVYRLDTSNPSESWTDLSGAIGNDNSPYVAAEDGDRILSLYLSRAGNTGGDHELILRDLDGSNAYAPPSLWGLNIAIGTFTSGLISSGTVTGSGSGTADNATGTGTGVRVVAGSGGSQAESAIGTGNGFRVVSGSGSAIAESAMGSGTGTVGSAITGSGSGTAENATGSGVGFRIITGTGGGTAETATGSGVGTVGDVITGSGSGTAEPATGSGTGYRVITGYGGGVAEPATGTGSGTSIKTVTGFGAGEANNAIGFGTGFRIVTGSGGGTANQATGSGSDAVPVIIAARHVIFCKRANNELYSTHGDNKLYSVGK